MVAEPGLGQLWPGCQGPRHLFDCILGKAPGLDNPLFDSHLGAWLTSTTTCAYPKIARASSSLAWLLKKEKRSVPRETAERRYFAAQEPDQKMGQIYQTLFVAASEPDQEILAYIKRALGQPATEPTGIATASHNCTCNQAKKCPLNFPSSLV